MMRQRCEILCCPVAAVDDGLLAQYRALLSGDERQRLAGYHSPGAAREFVIARALLRSALSQRLGCEPAALAFARDADGKPQLAHPRAAQLHFNLSHERNWIALIVGRSGPVGIDVESHRRRNNLAAIARRFFSARENAALDACAGAQWHAYFFAIWTLKEAHAKARGCGLAKILSCSSITLDWANARIDFELRDIARSPAPLSGWLYRLDEAVSLAAIAIAEKNAPALTRMVPLRSAQPLSAVELARGEWRPQTASR